MHLTPISDTPTRQQPWRIQSQVENLSHPTSMLPPRLIPSHRTNKVLAPEQHQPVRKQPKQPALKPQLPRLEPLNDFINIDTLRNEFERNKIKPGFPIPPQTMQFLMKYLKSFGVNLNKTPEISTPTPFRNPYAPKPYR